jgi:hypothetical protein
MKVVSLSRQLWSAPTSHSGSLQLLVARARSSVRRTSTTLWHPASSQLMMITQWPFHVGDRDAAKITI